MAIRKITPPFLIVATLRLGYSEGQLFEIPFSGYGYRFRQGAVCGCILVVLRFVYYYGIDNLLAGSRVSPATFKPPSPIHVFDVSKQGERLTDGVVDLTVRMEFCANVPANTQAFALVISDRMLKIKSDGSKMSVLF